ncbi:DUF257 family protein [Thermococcus profundus]|uniref:DUF257 family protein n=1 Tax=Thermococcus profundus TaxID=49899 RepID=UPI001E5AEFF4|nr:DUF257 family protein [Thermococcus profundus]
MVVEYRSEEPAYLVFQALIRGVLKSGKGFIIVDDLDQLHVFRTHILLSGGDTSIIDSAAVIKMGGILPTGKVVGRVDMTKEPPVRKKHYEELLAKVEGEHLFRIVVGFEKILSSKRGDPREIEGIFGYLIRPHLGKREKITIYMVNADIIPLETLKELREHATRALMVVFSREKIGLQVVKSIFPEDYGCEISIQKE